MSGAQRLPHRLLHGYGAAAGSLALANTAVMFFLLKFLVDVAGLTPGVAGTVLLVGKAWDAVSDPLVGRLSDLTRTRWGMRRPWIAGGTLPFVLLFASIWWGFGGADFGGGLALAVAYSLLLVVYNTAYTCVVVPYGALTPALTQDYDERTRLNGARMIWSMAGGIVAGVAFPMIFNQSSWALAGVFIAGLMVPGLLITLWATRGRDPVVEVPPQGSIWSVFGCRAFRRTAILFLLAWSTISVLSALVPFYVEHHLHRPGLLDAMFAAIQISALVTIPLVVLLSKRLQKHIAYALCMAAWAAVLVLLSAVPEGAVTPALLLALVVGPGVAAAHVLPWSMLPDVVEEDKVAQGEDRAGAFYGAMTFLEKSGTAVALWGLGIGLELAGYAEGVATQPESARLAICGLIGPLPALVLIGAALLAWRYPPMTRAGHRALVEDLEA
jgi:GPH family glycoside/pentoside/hexuronide:cation symporter